MHLGLPSSCEFQGKIGSGLGDMVAPSHGCRTVQPEKKLVSNPVKMFWLGFKFFRGVPWVIWILFVNWTMWIWRQQLSEHL
jgi:hypothetical protein